MSDGTYSIDARADEVRRPVQANGLLPAAVSGLTVPTLVADGSQDESEFASQVASFAQ